MRQKFEKIQTRVRRSTVAVALQKVADGPGSLDCYMIIMPPSRPRSLAASCVFAAYLLFEPSAHRESSASVSH
jgi:hypothetical protein